MKLNMELSQLHWLEDFLFYFHFSCAPTVLRRAELGVLPFLLPFLLPFTPFYSLASLASDNYSLLLPFTPFY